MPDQGLKTLYIDELKDLYSAENQLVKATQNGQGCLV
jgi:ferritin-like metal-binding protein YciE